MPEKKVIAKKAYVAIAIDFRKPDTWKGHGSRSQTKCFTSTLSYEGNTVTVAIKKSKMA